MNICSSKDFPEVLIVRDLNYEKTDFVLKVHKLNKRVTKKYTLTIYK